MTRVFRDDDNSVADEVQCMIHVLRFAGGRDRHVVADARVLVYDGVLDPAVARRCRCAAGRVFVFLDGFLRFVIVAAEDDDAVQFRAGADDGAQADDAVVDAGAVDDAAVGDDGVVDLRAVDLGAGQIARTGKSARSCRRN